MCNRKHKKLLLCLANEFCNSRCHPELVEGRGRAAPGYATLRHFVLAAKAATLRIPHASTCVIPRNEGTCVRNALSVWVLSYRRDDSMGCCYGYKPHSPNCRIVKLSN